MKKVLSYFGLLTVGVVMVLAAYFCHFYYTLYNRNVTELESKLNAFNDRLASIESHKSRELTPVHVWGIISTSEHPADEGLQFYLPSEKLPDGDFEAVDAKGGPHIRPEIRLSAGSITNHEFDVHLESQFGTVVDAWLSHAEPYQDLAVLQQFHVYCPKGTNIVRLNVQSKPNASIKLRFEIVILCEK